MIVYPVSFMNSQVWEFSPTPLAWSSSTAGYTQYGAGITSNAYTNGTTNLAIPLGFLFDMAATPTTVFSSTQGIRISTNGQFRVGTGAVDLTDNKPSIPPVGGAPLYYLNAGGPTGTAPVNILEPGAPLADGDTQNIWYKSDAYGAKSEFDALVFSGIEGDPNGISSYMFSLYRDQAFQWMVTRTKGTPNSTFAGPYNPSTDVSQTASTISRVWRVQKTTSIIVFHDWEYMGTGSVV